MTFPINPLVDDVHNIGDKIYRWDGYSWTKVSSMAVKTSYIGNVASDIIPTISNNYNIGSIDKKWDNLFLSNSITSNIWNRLYSSNVIEVDNLFFTNARVGLYLEGNLSGNIIPEQDATYSLGNTTHRFNQLFLSSNTTFTSSNSYIANSILLGTTYSQQFVESFDVITYAEGNVIHDFNSSAAFYHSNINTNFTANFINVPEINNKTISVSLILDQHANAYVANAVQINNVNTVVKYFNGIVESGTSGNINLQNFTLIRSNNTWTVLASISSFQ